MGANFQPEVYPYKETGSFRFWCQKVLPLVYDDSLSYYELLCKVVKYLNDVIANVDGLHDDVLSTNEAFGELQNYVNDYFADLDVQSEINAKLDTMAVDGSLSELLSPIVATQIGDVVGEQISDVVASQIDDVVAEQIDDAVREEIGPSVSPVVTEWLNTNVDPVGSAVTVDSSLEISGSAADAKVVGDRITALDDVSLNDHSNIVKLEPMWNSGGVVDNDGVIDYTVASTFKWCKIPVVIGEIYNVKTYVTTASGYDYYVYFVDDSDNIVASKIEGELAEATQINTDIVVPSGCTYMYVMSSIHGTYEVYSISGNWYSIDETDNLAMTKFDEQISVPITVNNGGVQNDSGSISTTASSAYKYCQVACRPYDVFTVTCTMRYSAGVTYPYYGFITDNSGNVLSQIIPYDKSLTSGTTKEVTVKVMVKSGTKLYVMSIDTSDISVKKGVPYWYHSIERLNKSVVLYDQLGEGLFDSARYTVLEKNSASKLLNFSFITDTHFNGGISGTEVSAEKNMALFVRSANEKWLDFCVHGGDMYSSYDMSDEEFFKTIDTATNVFGQVQIPFYWTKGNHEVNLKDGDEHRVSNVQWFILAQNRLVGEVNVNPIDPYGGYFYKDFGNVRVIDINYFCNEDNPSENAGMTEVEEDFIEECLNSANGKHVLVFVHKNIETTSNHVYRLLDSFIAGGGTVIAVIHGHTHNDDYTNQFGFNLIGVQRGFASPSEYGTADEYCFSVFSVDTANYKLYETRIGRGSSREFTYDTPNIVE